MRDLLIFAIVAAGCIAALRRPWIGIMLWTWLSVMNPHRFAYGMAYGAPLAAAAVMSVGLGLLMTTERESPFKASPVVWLTLFMVWMTLSWLVGFDVVGDYEQWKKVMKIDGMILVALMLLHNKQHIFGLAWVCTGSLALLGIKGGIFTLSSGGSYRVWGPPGSFIEDNNEMALALVMTIPLIRFLQLQLSDTRARHAMTGAMVLCACAALGSQSRGALVAISAMAFFLWLNGKNKLRMGFLILLAALPLIGFMPDSWTERMSSIGTYEEDGSAMGRINAWWTAWNVATHYPTGAGFNPATPETFARYSPNPLDIHAAHSIYFQVLGNHGFIGLILFLGLLVATWRSAGWLRRQHFASPDANWCNDLGAMCQVALAGYLVGGAFLSLSYFDLPYDIMVLVVLTRIWAEKQRWQTEAICEPKWFTIPGLAVSPKLI